MKFISLKTGAAICATLAFGAGVYIAFFSKPVETFTVKKTDVIEQIGMTGAVISAEDITLGFPADGAVAAVTVRAGGRVKRGDVLAELVTGGTEAEIKQYEAKIALEKEVLSRLLSGVDKQEVEFLELKARAAFTALDGARQEAEDVTLQTDNDIERQYALAKDYGDTILLNADNAMKALEGVYDEHNAFRGIFIVSESRERSDAEWQMGLSRTAHANIKKECATLKDSDSRAAIDAALANIKTNLEVIRITVFKTAEVLGGADVVFGAPEVGGFVTTMMVQRSVINATQTAILTIEEGIAERTIAGRSAINQAEKKIIAAESALALAEKELALKKSAATVGMVAMHQAQIKEYEASLAVLDAAIEGSVLRAPTDGIVARAALRPGMLVKKDAPVITITPSADMEVDARVSSSDAQKIRIGDAAHMWWGNAQADGRVVGIASNAVRVHFDDPSFASGIEGEVTGVIDAVIKRDVLMVPTRFLGEKDGMRFVNVAEDEEKKTVFVIVGAEKGGVIEIEEGVVEGDVLMMP